MTRGTGRRAFVISCVLLSLVSGVVYADARQDFARETGLDPDLIAVVQVDVSGTEMTVVFVFVNDRALDSHISPTLRATLLPYIGRNALYVNPSVRVVVDRFAFDPREIAVQPVGGDCVVLPTSAWVEITPGFLSGAFLVNPAGPAQGSGSEGILVLGDALDSTKPFTVSYGSELATFDLRADSVSLLGSTGSTPSLSHKPINVPALEDVTSLEDVLALPDLTADPLAALLELDRSLVRLLDVIVSSNPIRMIFVRLEESIRTSALGPDLLARLDSLIGTGAVMVWAWSLVDAPFSPWYFYIQQSGTNHVFFSNASFVELTAGFLDLARLTPGKLAAAVIRLPRSVDPTNPFAVRYGTVGVSYP